MRELTSKRLLESCRPRLTAVCPTMKLVATVTQKEVVDVWRFNGQRVFGLPVDDEDLRTVQDIAWRPDGHMLAVSLSSNLIVLIDSSTGKIAHQLQTDTRHSTGLPDWSTSTTSTLAVHDNFRWPTMCWTLHFTGVTLSASQSLTLVHRKEFADPAGILSDAIVSAHLKSHLPRDLARIDVESSLPKLPTLPPTGADDDVFSTRTAIDTIFHSQLPGSDEKKIRGASIDVLLTGTSFGTMHITIYDSFQVGAVGTTQALPRGIKAVSIIGHASHTRLSEHYLIVEGKSAKGPAHQRLDNRSLHVVKVDLRFIKQNSQALPTLAAKATQLQNLLRYLQQIRTQMVSEVRTAFDLPTRFLANIDESLKEQDSSASFAIAAYHLIVLGECDARLKEWLVDEVAERGLKRWEKAVGDCLEMMRRMTSECLLPAVERCQVVLSRLEGLARFEDTASRLGLDGKGIHLIRETLDALTILCEDTLRDVCTEIREFGAFMRWIKWEAEVEALEEGSERAEEMREAWAGESELRTVLDYINGPMQKSRVLEYIDSKVEGCTKEDDDTKEDGFQFYTNYKKARAKARRGAVLPKLGGLLDRLKAKCDTVFGNIAEALRKNVLVSHVAELQMTSDVKLLECQITGPKAGDQEMKLHILSSHAGQPQALLHAALHLTEGSQPTDRSISYQDLQIPGCLGIHDFKFIDEEGMVVLVSRNEGRQILWHPVKSMPDEEPVGSEEWEVKQTFPGGQMTGGMRAELLAAGGRQEAIVVSDEKMGFTAFSLEIGNDA